MLLGIKLAGTELASMVMRAAGGSGVPTESGAVADSAQRIRNSAVKTLLSQ